MNYYELYYYFLNNIEPKLQNEMVQWLKKRNKEQCDLITLHELFKRIVNQYPFLNEIDYNKRFKILKENIDNSYFTPRDNEEKSFIALFKNNQNEMILKNIEHMVNCSEREYYLKLYFVDDFKIKKPIMYKQLVVLFDQFREEILKNNHKHNFIIFKYVDKELENVNRPTLFTNTRNRLSQNTKNKQTKNSSFKINIK